MERELWPPNFWSYRNLTYFDREHPPASHYRELAPPFQLMGSKPTWVDPLRLIEYQLILDLHNPRAIDRYYSPLYPHLLTRESPDWETFQQARQDSPDVDSYLFSTMHDYYGIPDPLESELFVVFQKRHWRWPPKFKTFLKGERFFKDLGTRSDREPRDTSLHDFSTPKIKTSHEPYFSPELTRVLRRPKRQLLILGAVALGMAAGVGLAALGSYLFGGSSLLSLTFGGGATPQTVETLQDHEQRISVNEAAIKTLNESVAALASAQKEVYKNTQDLEVVIRGQLILDMMIREVSQISGGLTDLTRMRLSPQLVNTHNVAKAIDRLQDKLAPLNLRLLTKQVYELYNLECSWVMFENKTLQVYVHIPAYNLETPMNLYEFIPSPLQVAPNRFVIPTPQHSYLAVQATTESLFRSMTDFQFKSCNRLGRIYYCQGQNYYNKDVTSDCLASLYQGRASQVLDNCEVSVSKPEHSITQMNLTSFLVFHKHTQVINRKCPSWSQSDSITFQGYRMIDVPPGCFCTSQSFHFQGARSIYSGPELISRRPANLSLHFPTSLSEMEFDKIEHHLALVGSTKGIKIKNLATLFERERTENTIKLVSLSIFSLIVLIASLWFCCKCKDWCTDFRQRHREERETIIRESPQRSSFRRVMPKRSLREENARLRAKLREQGTTDEDIELIQSGKPGGPSAPK